VQLSGGVLMLVRMLELAMPMGMTVAHNSRHGARVPIGAWRRPAAGFRRGRT
jgi:hypothetical protein